MKILILVGSGDEVSHSLGIAKAIKSQLGESADSEIINLVEYGLPQYDRSIERAKKWDDKTRNFLDKTREADAYVWITPIYHGSFSGILKVALDWQHFFLDGKVVGLASNGDNRGKQAVDQLMIVARTQHLITTRVRICTQEDDFDDSKQLSSTNIQKRVVDFCNELVDVTNRFSK